MSLAFPKGTAGPAALITRKQPVTSRRAGQLGLLVAVGLLLAATMSLAATGSTAGHRPGAHGRANATAGRLAVARPIAHAAARPALSRPAIVSGPDTVSDPATRAVAAGRGSRSPSADRHRLLLTGRETSATAASMVWTAAGGTAGFGIAAICGLLIAAVTLATAVPTPSGGSRRGADVTRIVRRGAEVTRPRRRAAEAGRGERRGADVAHHERRSAEVTCLGPGPAEDPPLEGRAA